MLKTEATVSEIRTPSSRRPILHRTNGSSTAIALMSTCLTGRYPSLPRITQIDWNRTRPCRCTTLRVPIQIPKPRLIFRPGSPDCVARGSKSGEILNDSRV